MFYVRHHFESTYWRRNERGDFFDADLAGGSYYELAALQRWFTADMGLHHAHHLDSQNPNYGLQEGFDVDPDLQPVLRLAVWDSQSCAPLKLWDEEKSEKVSLSKAKRPSSLHSS